MNIGNQMRELRDFILYRIPATLAAPVLVAILEGDLGRLEAINKIIINLKGDALQEAVNELNQAMRDLGLRRSDFFTADRRDDMWFSFAALPHGSYRHGQGTLHVHALNGEGELIVLSPGARRLGAELAIEAVMLKSTDRGVTVESVGGAEALARIRSVLAVAIAERAAAEGAVH
jgi:hypothetical protein